MGYAESKSIYHSTLKATPYVSVDPPAVMEVAEALKGFTPISLDAMNAVALQDRVETKFLMRQTTLLQMLNALQSSYQVLTIQGQQLLRYRTLYYDTPNFAFYHSHHAGLRDRYKVRAREYVDTAVSFFEVKHKTNKKRTQKYRLPTDHLVDTLTGSDGHATSSFLHNAYPYDTASLRPVLWNHYRRITLVNKTTVERVTLDMDLGFGWQGRQQELSQLVIAEVKQADRHQPSPFIQAMRAAHVHAGGFSKYCMGVMLLYPQVKANRFKRKQRYIAKLLQDNSDNTWASQRGISHE